MFAGHETSAKTVHFLNVSHSRSISTYPLAYVCTLGACSEAACSGKAPSGNHGNVGTSQGQG